jgi:hypothetical protein
MARYELISDFRDHQIYYTAKGWALMDAGGLLVESRSVRGDTIFDGFDYEGDPKLPALVRQWTSEARLLHFGCAMPLAPPPVHR